MNKFDAYPQAVVKQNVKTKEKIKNQKKDVPACVKLKNDSAEKEKRDPGNINEYYKYII